MNNPDDTQAQTVTDEHHRDMHRLRTERQQTGHTVYASIAAGLGGLALLAAGNVLREAAVGSPAPPTRGYLAFLAAAVVLGVAASAAAAVWMSIRVTQRMHGESDRLREYDNDHLVKNVVREMASVDAAGTFAERVAEEVTRLLDARERAARQRRWENLIPDTGTTGPGSTPLPTHQRGSGDPVIPFARRHGGARNSG